jgi:DNA-binding PadR family transcriptional regulator
MYGGSIRFEKNTRHKNFMNDNMFKKLSQIIQTNGSQWNYYVSLFQRMERDKLFTYSKNLSEQINKIGYPIKRGQLYEMLEQMESVGLIEQLKQNVEQLSFYYANNSVRHYLTDNGAVLEEIVYRTEREKVDDCMMSVNLDWDGVAEETTEKDVVNEIDVLSLNGYELTFISCKNTIKIKKEDLYELETISRKFGGKYARMKLATTGDVSAVELERAKNMGVAIAKF